MNTHCTCISTDMRKLVYLHGDERKAACLELLEHAEAKIKCELNWDKQIRAVCSNMTSIYMYI